jgi:formamidopyrimidine-DNA glycosylase
MPELPEVETVARGLKKNITGLIIARVEVRKTAWVYPRAHAFKLLLSGAAVVNIHRRGKNILIDLSNDQTLWIHLKMTGHFYFLPKDEPITKHDHVVFHFQNDDRTLRFNDYRRFGRLRIYPTDIIMQQKGLANLGPEPLEISAEEFVRLIRARRRMIKLALLDQSLIAGIGNIYADEVLFFANIHPRRLTDSIPPKRLAELHSHIQAVLKKAIKLMGTSVDTYTGLNGRPGRYQKYLMVYSREGQPCFACGRKVVREIIGSRSAHFCPDCQKAK